MNKQEAAYTLGKNLERVRLEKGLSRRALGLRAGLSEDTIYKIERGRRSPRIGTLLWLTQALGVDVDVLLEGISWRPGDGRS